ncbi:MAG: hypothetical protein EZS28_001064, partial [Streblomastix strix]
RRGSRKCLDLIQQLGDESDQAELVSIGYAGEFVITFSTAGGNGEEQDKQIRQGLNHIFWFLKDLRQGRNDPLYQQFPPLPQLARRSNEQIEEEGGNEDVDAQMNNNGEVFNIKYWAKLAKVQILNCFIDNSNTKPDWYN